MKDFITTSGIGLAVCILGIINMSGNISTLHRYHRHRVSEENRRAFGKLVGLGTFIIGLAFIIFGTLLYIAEKMNVSALITAGSVELGIGIIVGAAISFYAMKKYNGGIF